MKILSKSKLKQMLYDQFNHSFDRKKSLENWLVHQLCHYQESAEQTLIEITSSGCGSGCLNNVIYTFDCIKLYQRYEIQIWDLVYDHLADTDQTLGQFIDSFHQTVIEDQDTLKVHFLWFAIETIAHRILCQFLPY